MQPKKSNTFTAKDLSDADEILKTIPYYPKEETTRLVIGEFIAKICPSKEALKWLVTTLSENCRQWPALADVRGMLCTRYKPADGVEGYCEIPGFTASDSEMKYIENHDRIKAAEQKEVPGLQKLLEQTRSKESIN